jgi:hypothetical protein
VCCTYVCMERQKVIGFSRRAFDLKKATERVCVCVCMC